MATGQTLEEIQRRALRRQHRGSRAAHVGDDRASGTPIPIGAMHGHDSAGIELTKGLGRDVEAGDDAVGLREDDPGRAQRGTDRRLRGDVAPAEIFGQRLR